MRLEERIAALEKENQKLRDDNETMMQIILQMKMTVNRLLDHYLLREQEM